MEIQTKRTSYTLQCLRVTNCFLYQSPKKYTKIRRMCQHVARKILQFKIAAMALNLSQEVRLSVRQATIPHSEK